MGWHVVPALETMTRPCEWVNVHDVGYGVLYERSGKGMGHNLGDLGI